MWQFKAIGKGERRCSGEIWVWDQLVKCLDRIKESNVIRTITKHLEWIEIRPYNMGGI